MSCTAESCDKPVLNRGLCYAHYLEVRAEEQDAVDATRGDESVVFCSCGSKWTQSGSWMQEVAEEFHAGHTQIVEEL